MANLAGNPISGAGGYAAISYMYPSGVYVLPVTAVTLTAGDWMLLDNSQYDIDATAFTSDVTTSNSYGWNEGLGGNVKVNSVSIQFPEDDPSSIDGSILDMSVKYNLWLKRGNDDLFDLVLGAVFAGFGVSNNSMTGEDRKCTARFEFGVLFRSAARGGYPSYKGQSWAGTSCDTFLSSLTPAR